MNFGTTASPATENCGPRTNDELLQLDDKKRIVNMARPRHNYEKGGGDEYEDK
jgi:hypothetical protein